MPLAHRRATYTDVFSTVLKKAGERDDKVVAITAAMMDGTGLKRFARQFPERFVDVGMAEEQAATFAAALALSGLKPVVCVYSSFLQRAFDEIMHDVCMQKLPVVFAIDRAGLVGADGETHQGIFDLSYLSMMPHMTIMAPKNKWELSDMVKFALTYEAGPVAIRYPKSEAYEGLREYRARIIYGKVEEIWPEGDVLLLALGSMVSVAESVREALEAEGRSAALVNARFAKPLDEDFLRAAMKRYRGMITMEENVMTGGFGEQVQAFLSEEGYEGKVLRIAFSDAFVPHGDAAVLRKACGMDPDSICTKIRDCFW